MPPSKLTSASYDWLANEGTNTTPETRDFIAHSVADEGVCITTNLKGIVVIGSIKDFEVTGVPGVQGVIVRGPNYLAREEFKRELAYFLGRPLTFNKVNRLQRHLGDMSTRAGYPAVDIWLPEQQMVDDVVQLLVKPPGKTGEPKYGLLLYESR